MTKEIYDQKFNQELTKLKHKLNTKTKKQKLSYCLSILKQHFSKISFRLCLLAQKDSKFRQLFFLESTILFMLKGGYIKKINDNSLQVFRSDNSPVNPTIIFNKDKFQEILPFLEIYGNIITDNSSNTTTIDFDLHKIIYSVVDLIIEKENTDSELWEIYYCPNLPAKIC